MRNRLWLVALAFGACFVLAGASQQPPATHGLIHIRNESRARASVYHKWGNGAWKLFVIERGKAAYFSWRYDGTSQRSPDFFVRLDIDTQGTHFMEHILTRGASPDDNSPKYGHHYVIKQLENTDTRFIQAITARAKVTVTDRKSTRPNVR